VSEAASRPTDRGGKVRPAPSAVPVLSLPPRPEPLANINDVQRTQAHENRLRVKFLATKGNTMPMWLAERSEILAADASTSSTS
jgi:hypothetical protein